MKSIKKFCAALSLALILTVSAMAGDMHGGFVAPPPPPDQAQSTTTADQITETTDSSESSLDPLTEGLISVLQSLFALF